MKQVLLATWYENHNYGTALQAFSLKEVIEHPTASGIALGSTHQSCSCKLLPHKPVRQKRNRLSKLLSTKTYFNKIGQMRDKIITMQKRSLFRQRDALFQKFVNSSFTFAVDHDVQERSELKSLADCFDLVISGSDQIWNPEALDPTYLLGWVEAGKKCSYGSSLSVKSIKEEDEIIYREALADFKAISIRDSACRSQLQEIVGKPVETVVDPVILLGKEGLLSHAPTLDLEPSLFSYFLGNNRSHREVALTAAKKMGLSIHAVINAGSDFAADKPLEQFADWSVDPWKFVSYINESEYVVTDSFHATVISVLCHTDFIVLEKDVSRPEQNNRILEFLKAVGLINRWGARELSKPIDPEQWRCADEALLRMRKDSFEFLMEALS
ncbi:polysaccharide pyruvyl transferase family protein [Collinsella sp. An2]|uniref:polysaccharide pyruvyl transferase family protein n=1 Tax=Collinsella sp. An2 TaxID=1965585 RepID=UPI000B39D8CB|nr:polysaccharide pyruvyl transferase family protein [Collinsella sp. An2]OUP08475.1 hypothetical protein B5F33_07185 [Collinsella sp. An2]